MSIIKKVFTPTVLFGIVTMSAVGWMGYDNFKMNKKLDESLTMLANTAIALDKLVVDTSDYAIVVGSPNYVPVQTNLGMVYLKATDQIREVGGTTQILVQFLNPYNMGISNCNIDFDAGLIGSDNVRIAKRSNVTTADFNDLEAGVWTTVRLQIGGVPMKDVTYIQVNSLHCEKIMGR